MLIAMAPHWFNSNGTRHSYHNTYITLSISFEKDLDLSDETYIQGSCDW